MITRTKITKWFCGTAQISTTTTLRCCVVAASIGAAIEASAQAFPKKTTGNVILGSNSFSCLEETEKDACLGGTAIFEKTFPHPGTPYQTFKIKCEFLCTKDDSRKSKIAQRSVNGTFKTRKSLTPVDCGKTFINASIRMVYQNGTSVCVGSFDASNLTEEQKQEMLNDFEIHFRNSAESTDFLPYYLEYIAWRDSICKFPNEVGEGVCTAK